MSENFLAGEAGGARETSRQRAMVGPDLRFPRSRNRDPASRHFAYFVSELYSAQLFIQLEGCSSRAPQVNGSRRDQWA